MPSTAARRFGRDGLGTAAAPLWFESLAASAHDRAHALQQSSAGAATADWVPKTLDAHQDEMIVALSELIIPETDTPGARAALVNRFVDAAVGDAEEADRRSFLSGFGECLPRFENYCELDPVKVDAWGIPVLRFHVAFGDNERRMVKDMADCAEEMLAAAGAEDIERTEEIPLPGLAIHEVGTARMGDDAKTSVVNRWQQAHDVRNLFVMDGSVYLSSACRNPTLTIMALASRACNYLLEQHRRGAV